MMEWVGLCGCAQSAINIYNIDVQIVAVYPLHVYKERASLPTCTSHALVTYILPDVH